MYCMELVSYGLFVTLGRTHNNERQRCESTKGLNFPGVKIANHSMAAGSVLFLQVSHAIRTVSRMETAFHGQIVQVHHRDIVITRRRYIGPRTIRRNQDASKAAPQ